MRIRLLLGPLLGILFVVRPLPAQDTRLTSRLDSMTASAVQRLVDSARTLGLPTEPVVQKALEGQTFGAPRARILAVTGELIGRLAMSRQALGATAAPAEITAGAAALRVGVSADALTQLKRLRQGGKVLVPIAVLTDMVTAGIPSGRAVTSVLDLARDGRSDADFMALQQREQAAPAPPPMPLPRPQLDVSLHGLPQLAFTSTHQPSDEGAVVAGVAVRLALSAATTLRAGRAFGTTWGGAWRNMARDEVELTRRIGRVRLGVAAGRVSYGARVSTQPEAPPRFDTLTIAPQGLGVVTWQRRVQTDARLRLGGELGRLELGGSFGRRFGGADTRSTFWSAMAVHPIVEGVGVLFAVGRGLSDPVTAIPASSYSTIGLRLDFGTGRRARPAPPPAVVLMEQLMIGPAYDGRRTVEVRWAGASSLELAGDFTDWVPVPLAPVPPSRWRTTLPIVAGVHRLVIRVDGGPWLVPPGVPRMSGDFDREVGEILVQ